MKFPQIFGIILTICLGLAFQANAGFLDKLGEMTDRIVDRTEQKVEDRLNEKAEDAVDCALTDKECIQKKEVQKAPVVNTRSSSATMKCVVTDVACLQEAKSLGKQIEIVDETDLDKLRCTVTDIECLQKAKQLGKQVEIID